ncbi:hypothetical protein Pla108_01660 [Botrimarina colliarenosi]|uniref:YhaN AAA domain-containing protein n=1 Tax=Botrimarina colliarenosi TaxID=2528001 RepID=A0A5C6AJN2_9BACT|nr:AAA family ATPase [Botrimarina colliarenosi]TWT99231.1 hypothetical protein Pla108_01660 [Botrimarina colliarenosi]
MKLTDLHVDGFGVWRDLRLSELSPTITVLYGPNEAGKTTLMHFLRAMLYGVTAERRERYLPPREGGRPGGSLGLLSDDGAFDVERYVERGDGDRGRVSITLPDGEQQGDRLLRDALESVDERTYCNVFAIGLDEINELGALEGAEAARWIYRLTSGLDRVSLYDVIQGLRKSRKQLIGPAGESSIIADLLGKRDRLQTEIDELVIDSRRWSKLAVEIDEVESQSTQLQAELKETEKRARRIEIALGLKPLWAERERVVEERRQYESLPDLGDKPLTRLEELNTKAGEHQRQRHTLRGQRRELHKEMQELGVNEVLMRSCCRLDALGEQQDWLAALERQSAELGEEVERLDARVESETARLAKLWRHKPSPEAAPELNDDTLETLKPVIESVGDAERMVAESKRELDALRGHERNYDVQLEGALTSSEKLGLPNNIEEAGELVSSLRRRLKAEQKVEQSRRTVADLADQCDRLVERQVVPIELFVLLTAAFSAAAVVVFWGWIAPADTSWISKFGLPALLAAGGCWFARYLIEDNRANELDICRQQLEAAEQQVQLVLKELGVLDDELHLNEGSVVVRLQHAEKHLEELERMLPVETERRKASQKTAASEEFYRSAKEELARAEKEWRVALKSVGLPDETTASEIEKLAGQYRSLAEMRSRAEAKQEEIDRCEREHEKLAKRIVALAEEADLVLDDAEVPDQLEHLLSERRLQQTRIDHRKKLRDRSKELKERERKHAALAERVESDLQALFAQARAEDEQAFRQVVADIETAGKLAENYARLTREIAAAIGPHGTEADFVELMNRERALRLDGLWAELTSEHDTLEKQLRELAVRKATLEKERQAMVEDTTVADKQVQLDLIEAQIAAAGQRWRERAAVGAMLELIRNDYEEHRQPETLLEASRYLEQLTRGRYPRVWTPLADDILMVDTADGESLPVESLSRGTREQLFLSVRMALVATFARRGVSLPMILDDVLVNFDDTRARIAASVLSEFAKDGHQVLLFTCHEHVRRMFNDLAADVRRLPSRYEEEPLEEAIVEEEAVEEIVELEEPEVVEEPEIAEEEAVETEPPVVERVAYIDAEYLPLEPVVETRRVVEVIEAPQAEPTVIDEAVPEAYEPLLAAIDVEELAYGRLTEEADGIEYGRSSTSRGYGTPRSFSAEEVEPPPRASYPVEHGEEFEAYVVNGNGAAHGADESDPWRVVDDEAANASWLDEAQAAWAETSNVR